LPRNNYIRCPGCRAKLRFGRRPKPRVTCPRCGHQFEYIAKEDGDTAAEPSLDPFLESAQSQDVAEETHDPFAEPKPSHNAADDDGETDEFSQALQEAAKAPPAADDEYGTASPLIRPVVSREKLPPVIELKSPVAKKKKRRRSAAIKPSTWRYTGGVLLVLLMLVFLRFVVFGNRLTMDEIAGTYICDKNPGIKVTLYADGTCAVEDSRQGVDLNVGGIEYAIDGRKIALKLSEEMKPARLSPAELIIMLARGGSAQIDEAVHEFNDLSFEHGTLYSSSKGRFTKEEDLEEGRKDEG
jgi:hypothetical protein